MASAVTTVAFKSINFGTSRASILPITIRKVSSFGIPTGQIAEALGKRLASDTFESYSAETVIKEQINQDAVRLIKQLYHIDMEQTQYNKLLSDIPSADIVITMGVMWTVRACHAGTGKTGDCMIRPAWTIPFLRIPYC